MSENESPALVEARGIERSMTAKDLEIDWAKGSLKALREEREKLVTMLRNAVRDSTQEKLAYKGDDDGNA